MPHEKWMSERLRPLATVARPRFAVPRKAIDTHMHVFGPAELYPGALEARYTLPEGSLDQYRALADVLGLEKVVFVQPSYYGADNSCLLHAMEHFGRPCRGVVFLPENCTAAAIADFHRRGVRGIRLDFFKTEPEGIGAIAKQLRRAASLARDAGWHIELYSPGQVTRGLFDELAGLDVDFSVNHLGYMKRDYGVTDADFARFVELARTEHCWIKLTGPYRVASDEQRDLTDAMARTLIAAAPARVIWGTDWPHLPHGSRDTGELLNRLADWCPDEAQRAEILVNNPARLYRFA